jgi:hypothetical protein
MDPESFKGGLAIVLMGVGAGLTALIIAQLFPSIIPAQATGVNL